MACLPVAQGIVDLSSVLHEPALHKPARATSTQEPILAFMSRVWSMSGQNRDDVFAHLMVQIASRLDDAVAHSTDDADLALDAACGSVRLRSGPELDDSQTLQITERFCGIWPRGCWRPAASRTFQPHATRAECMDLGCPLASLSYRTTWASQICRWWRSMSEPLQTHHLSQPDPTKHSSKKSKISTTRSL